MPSNHAAKVLPATVILVALAALPVPLLPPHRLAQGVQSALGVSWKAAYLVAALGLQSAFYGSLGVLATLVVDRATTVRGRILNMALVPWVVVGIALLIRSVKAGNPPVWTNAVVPVVACLVGVWLGLGLQYRKLKETLVVGVAVIGGALWGWRAGPSSALTLETQLRLQRLVAASPSPLSDGDARFGLLLRAAFAALPDETGRGGPVDHNRAAILALGIAIGHERLARLAGLERDTALVRQAVVAGTGATLRGREDWSKHFTVSAALAILAHPLISDAAGLMKEQLDALTQGSGFSFGDLAADRAGVRFAAAATHSDAAAETMQSRLRHGFAPADYFPPAADLPEDLTEEEFRRRYGRVGSPLYRQMLAAIEVRLDSCPGLSAAATGNLDGGSR
jgi:hypothetical protein